MEDVRKLKKTGDKRQKTEVRVDPKRGKREGTTLSCHGAGAMSLFRLFRRMVARE